MRRIAELLDGWEHPDTIPALERDLLLEKLRAVYEAVRFPEPTSAARTEEDSSPEPIDLGAVLGLGMHSRGENSAPRLSADSEERSGEPFARPDAATTLPAADPAADTPTFRPADTAPAAATLPAAETASPSAEESDTAARHTPAPDTAAETPQEAPAPPAADAPTGESLSPEPCDATDAAASVSAPSETPETPETPTDTGAEAARSGESAPRQAMPSLFGVLEEEHRHRRKQRVIMSLYDADPERPARKASDDTLPATRTSDRTPAQQAAPAPSGELRDTASPQPLALSPEQADDELEIITIDTSGIEPVEEAALADLVRAVAQDSPTDAPEEAAPAKGCETDGDDTMHGGDAPAETIEPARSSHPDRTDAESSDDTSDTSEAETDTADDNDTVPAGQAPTGTTTLSAGHPTEAPAGKETGSDAIAETPADAQAGHSGTTAADTDDADDSAAVAAADAGTAIDLAVVNDADATGEDSAAATADLPLRPAADRRTGPNTGSVLGEVINADSLCLADVIAPPHENLAGLHRQEPVGNLRQAIGLNDRFLMINELFDGDASRFDAAVEAFNACESIDDCMLYALDNDYAWNPNSDGVKLLMELLERKFNR